MSITVPWNAAWSGEMEFRVQYCRWAGQLAIHSPHRPGTGRPVFAKPHVVRQRRSIIEMLCSVCGKPTPPRDRWWFALGDFQVVPGHFCTTESPVHHACAVLAQELCPHLKRSAPDLTPFPKGHKIAKALIGGEPVKRDFGIDVGNRQVVGALKFIWEVKTFRADGTFELVTGEKHGWFG